MSTTANTLIRASAGSGKTFQLTRRYLSLLLAGHDPATLLATTFTVKAAGEIAQETIQVLARALSDPKALAELSEHIKGFSAPETKPVELELWRAADDGARAITTEDCRAALRRLVAAFPTLRICTLDSLFVRTTMTQALRLGLPIKFDVVQSDQQLELMERAMEGVLAERLQGEGGLNRLMDLVYAIERGQAKRSPYVALWELTGKPYELFLDSDEAAWRHVRPPAKVSDAKLEQAKAALRAFAGDKRMATAINGDVDRFEAEEWEDFIGKGVAKKVHDGEATYGRKPIPQGVSEPMKVLLQQVGHKRVSEVVARNEAVYAILKDFHERYLALKRSEKTYVFGDLPILLAKSERNPFLAQGTPIEHVLLDEFQDTSVTQWRALLPLLDDLRGKPERSFFCVGDIKQAIYGWRGGSAELFKLVPDVVRDLEEQSLELSWRSSPVITGFVNQVFESIAENKALASWPRAATAWQDAFKTHSAKKDQMPGYVCIETAPSTSLGQGGKLLTWKYAAEMVKKHHERQPGRSIGVLTRTNKAVARLIFELSHMGIRASEEGGVPLTDSSAVLVILSALTLADHPGDRAALFNLQTSPLAKVLGLGESSLDAGSGPRPSRPPLDTSGSECGRDARGPMEAPETTAACVASAIRNALLQRGYGNVIADWVQALAPECDARNLERLKHLERLAIGYAGTQRGGLHTDALRPGEFVEFIRRQRVEDPSSSPVRVMTIHKAKGLEFDIVVLPDLDCKLVGNTPLMVSGRSAPAEPCSIVCSYASGSVRAFLPDEVKAVFAAQKSGVVGEALCNLYVALTRPRHALHIILAPSKDNERTLPKTYAGVLRAALGATAPMPPGKVIHEHGDPQWDRGRPARNRVGGGMSADEDVCPTPDRGRPARTLEQRNISATETAVLLTDQEESPSPLVGEPLEAPSNVEGGRDERSESGVRGQPHLTPRPSTRSGPPTPEQSGGSGTPLLRPGRTRFFPRTSPSTKVEGESASVDAIKLLDVTRRPAAERGTAIHALCQQIGWMEDGLPSDEQLTRALAPEHRASVAKLLPDLHAMLAKPKIKERLSRAYYEKAWANRCGGQPLKLHLYRELPFTHKTDEELISGQIDRLVVGYAGDKPIAAEALDFKTDAGDPDELAQHYAPQMAAYTTAAARFTQLPEKEIGGYLLFLKKGSVVRV